MSETDDLSGPYIARLLAQTRTEQQSPKARLARVAWGHAPLKTHFGSNRDFFSAKRTVMHLIFSRTLIDSSCLQACLIK